MQNPQIQRADCIVIAQGSGNFAPDSTKQMPQGQGRGSKCYFLESERWKLKWSLLGERKGSPGGSPAGMGRIPDGDRRSQRKNRKGQKSTERGRRVQGA